MKRHIDEWLESGDYLPECIHDFHDQKKLFQRIQWLVQARKEKDKDSYAKEMPNWVVNHVYVIDIFLWFMAKMGYTLQKNRTKVDFLNVEDAIKELEDHN